jgi:hypothetical protein
MSVVVAVIRVAVNCITEGGESNSPIPWAAVDHNFPMKSH